MYFCFPETWDVPDEERYDIIPEIYLGHNVADFIDPDIMKVRVIDADYFYYKMK